MKIKISLDDITYEDKQEIKRLSELLQQTVQHKNELDNLFLEQGIQQEVYNEQLKQWSKWNKFFLCASIPIQLPILVYGILHPEHNLISLGLMIFTSLIYLGIFKYRTHLLDKNDPRIPLAEKLNIKMKEINALMP